uniref:(northern house mosquito) hypothetical protein n=1 Tax=Culex pipiens TaxID=7175 RepID=A0A8D8CE52_CULPI
MQEVWVRIQLKTFDVSFFYHLKFECNRLEIKAGSSPSRCPKNHNYAGPDVTPKLCKKKKSSKKVNNPSPLSFSTLSYLERFCRHTILRSFLSSNIRSRTMMIGVSEQKYRTMVSHFSGMEK